MKPVQVYFGDHEARQLEAFARERGWTKSKAIRVAVAALTRPPMQDPLLQLSGMVRDLPPHLASNTDRYLAETFDAETTATQNRRTSRPRARRR